MGRESRQAFDVLVIGGGPAGMAAAVRAAECGKRVGLVDENADCGGQIWRADLESGPPGESRLWHGRLRNVQVTRLHGKRVVDLHKPGLVLAEGLDDFCELKYEKLVLATGARERFLPFPGWTLPNVLGAGGLQAMVKGGLPVRGKRVLVAGSGPLLLAVAAYLKKHGAEIPMICEQAPWSRLAALAAALWRYPAKIGQARQLKKELGKIRFLANTWPMAAHGRDRLESITVSRGGKTEVVACDYLACGFHLVPNVELAQLLKCKISGGCVVVDELQRTSVNGIFCAGEPTGIGGVELALVEGQIAGFAAAGGAPGASKLFRERRKWRQFATLLERTFHLRPELQGLATGETIVCRCEDVAYSRLQQFSSWRAAKLQARCGMGPCQGRVCGPAAQFLFGWNPESVRPPVFPARIESLSTAD